MSVLKRFLRIQGGFSLIEIGVVLIATGMTMLAATQFVELYVKNKKYTETIENLIMATDALKEYVALTGSYPCPADPTASPSDSDYGVSKCRDMADSGYDKNSCTIVPTGIECTTIGSRDGDGVGGNDVVMIGALPFKTIVDEISTTPFTLKHRKDGYNNLLSYAVTEHMSDSNSSLSLSNPVNPLTGAIRVVDENLIDITDPPESAHFVVFSHGLNGMGAHSVNGRSTGNLCLIPQISFPTGPATETPTPGMYGGLGRIETENCDNNDAIFVQGIFSIGNNNSYYDDFLYYVSTGLTSLWKRSLTSPSGQSYIYNTNLGNVGVDTQNPTSTLHVMGNIAAENSMIAPEYCDPTQTNCLDPNFLGGTGDTCGTNEVAYAIGENQIECRTIDWVNPNHECQPIGGDPSFMQGFSNLGNLYCCTESGNCNIQ